ncbi:unnamed protein product, partial [Phaeothamnion confervicola]
MSAIKMWKVVIFQHRLLHYRIDFFNRLRDACIAEGINIELVHGQAAPSEKSRQDESHLEWATPVVNTWFRVGSKDLLWQRLPSTHRDADIFVIMQESRILSNYPLLMKHAFGLANVAYWGHGANFQSMSRDGVRERWKRFLIGQVDWWFAYTNETRKVLLASNVEDARISVLNNAIDTEGFIQQLESLSENEIATFRSSERLSDEDLVGVYCGSLY